MGSYAADGDHPKRMVSVEANSKFASPETGADEPWQVKLLPLSACLSVQALEIVANIGQLRACRTPASSACNAED